MSVSDMYQGRGFYNLVATGSQTDLQKRRDLLKLGLDALERRGMTDPRGEYGQLTKTLREIDEQIDALRAVED